MHKVTIKDVAQKAGVSITTASFALNNVKSRVSEEVRQQVLQCAKELNYTVNANARILRTNVSNTVLMVYSEEFLLERNASTMLAVAGAMKYANEHGKEVLLNTINSQQDFEEAVEQYKRIWASQRVEGMVFQCHFEDERDDLLYKELYNAGVNLVNISRIGRSDDYPCVYLDDYRIIRQQVIFIRNKGYREIYYLCKESKSQRLRDRGYQDAVREFGLMGHTLYYDSYMRSKEQLWEILEPVVAGAKQQIAIMCWNDVDAVNVIETLQEHRYKVPDQVGVMGFDDIPLAEHISPRLTTVSQPFDDMAYKAMELLSQATQKPKERIIRSVELPGMIVERQSI